RVVTTEPLAQTTQTIRVGRRGTNLDRHTLTVKQMKVETLATEIQTGVQHCNGPPFVSRGRAEHDSAAGPSSWHSLPWRLKRSPAGWRNRASRLVFVDLCAFGVLLAVYFRRPRDL